MARHTGTVSIVPSSLFDPVGNLLMPEPPMVLKQIDKLHEARVKDASCLSKSCQQELDSKGWVAVRPRINNKTQELNVGMLTESDFKGIYGNLLRAERDEVCCRIDSCVTVLAERQQQIYGQICRVAGDQTDDKWAVEQLGDKMKESNETLTNIKNVLEALQFNAIDAAHNGKLAKEAADRTEELQKTAAQSQNTMMELLLNIAKHSEFATGQLAASALS